MDFGRICMSFKSFYKSMKFAEKTLKTNDQEIREKINIANKNTTKEHLKAIKDLKDILKKSFVFKLPKNLATLFYLTDNEDKTLLENHKLPYEYIFLDCDLIYEGYKIDGFLFYIDKNEKGEDTIFVEFTIIKELNDYDGYFEKIDIFDKDEFNKMHNDTKNYVGINFKDELRENVKCLILNFLEHINNPSVEFILKEYSKSNYGSLSNKICGSKEIVLYGKLKRYVYEIGEKMKDVTLLKKAHWVRGHWKHFHSEKFVNKKGLKTWVYPYIRGIGNAKKKDYLLKEDKE